MIFIKMQSLGKKLSGGSPYQFARDKASNDLKSTIRWRRGITSLIQSGTRREGKGKKNHFSRTLILRESKGGEENGAGANGKKKKRLGGEKRQA